jgi:hypothetical protein
MKRKWWLVLYSKGQALAYPGIATAYASKDDALEFDTEKNIIPVVEVVPPRRRLPRACQARPSGSGGSKKKGKK